MLIMFGIFLRDKYVSVKIKTSYSLHTGYRFLPSRIKSVITRQLALQSRKLSVIQLALLCTTIIQVGVC